MKNRSYNLKLTKLPRIITTLAGVNPILVTNSRFLQTWYTIYRIVLLGMFYSIVCIYFSFCVPRALDDKDLPVIAMSISNGVRCIMAAYKVTICLTARMRNQFKKCFSEQQETYGLRLDEGTEKVLTKNYLIFNTVYTAVLLSVTVVSGILTSVCVLYFLYMEFNHESTWVDPLLDLFPFPDYPKIGVFYKVMGCVVTWIYEMLTTLYFLSLTMYVCGQLDAIHELLKNLKADEHAFSKVRSIAMWHQNVIGFVKETNSILAFNLLVQYVMSAIVIAALLFVNLIPNNTVTFKFYSSGMFVSYTMQLFLLAWQADEIYSKSRAVSDAISESTWYEQSKQVKAVLHFIILRAQRPLTLDCGGFFPMTLNSALTTIKLAYSYATMAMGVQ